MRDYFEAEMRLLRESAQQFAESYPEQASQLNLQSLRDWDPYVERLLEGTAFLTAQIRQRIDDDIPEISETLLNQLWPHILRPFPACTIMSFQPRTAQLQQKYILPQNTQIKSKKVGNAEEQNHCTFRTTREIALHPLTVKQVNVAAGRQGGSDIQIELQTTAPIAIAKLNLTNLEFYLQAEPTIAMHIFYALLGGGRQLRISFPGFPQYLPQIIPIPFVSTEKFSPENALLPPQNKSFYGFQLLQEYFAFRENFLFVTIQGLQNINFPPDCQHMLLEINTSVHFPPEYTLHKDNFMLNCVPAVNLFTQSSEPLQLTAHRYQYPVNADAQATQSAVIYSIDKVTSIEERSGRRQTYAPLSSFLHRLEKQPYFQINQRPGLRDMPVNWLTLGEVPSYQSQTLTCEITACNGHFPRRYLSERSLTESSKNLQDLFKIENIVRPSALLLPPIRENFRWILISHLSLNLQTIQTRTTLQQVLHLYNWSEREENRRRIEGIADFTLQHKRSFYQGAWIPTLEFQFILNEEYYLSLADCYFFGFLLHRFLHFYAPINTRVITRLSCQPSQQEFVWQS